MGWGYLENVALLSTSPHSCVGYTDISGDIGRRRERILKRGQLLPFSVTLMSREYRNGGLVPSPYHSTVVQ